MKNAANELSALILWILFGFFILQAIDGNGKKYIMSFFTVGDAGAAIPPGYQKNSDGVIWRPFTADANSPVLGPPSPPVFGPPNPTPLSRKYKGWW